MLDVSRWNKIRLLYRHLVHIPTTDKFVAFLSYLGFLGSEIDTGRKRDMLPKMAIPVRGCERD